MNRTNCKLLLTIIIFLIIYFYSLSNTYNIFSFYESNYRDKLYKISQLLYPQAKCMDGTQPSFYHRSGFGDGKDKWIVFFEGGGWCYTLDECLDIRYNSDLGSSKNYPEYLIEHQKHYLSEIKHENPLMYNWNTVLVKYCDGGSYAGNSKVIHKNKTLYFHGKHNRDATINYLINHLNMSNSNEIVLGGCSAGALGIYLGIDQMSEIINNNNNNNKIKIRGLADSGFFLDYKSNKNPILRASRPDRKEAMINNILDYSKSMKKVFIMQNIASGANPNCIKYYKKLNTNTSLQETKCFFAQYLTPFIKTPIFAIQPMFDQWQIWHILGQPYNNKIVNEYGIKSIKLLQSSLLLSEPSLKYKSSHGAFVDSCTHHCTSCSSNGEDSWNGPNILSNKGKLTESDAFNIWYNNNNNSNKFEPYLDIKKSKFLIMQNFYIQERNYPCLDCCICKIM